VFLLVQVILLTLIVRVPMSRHHRWKDHVMLLLFVLLVTNTVLGCVWLSSLSKEYEEYLKTRYYIESLILLAIPIAVAFFFVVFFFVGLCYIYFENRRQMRHAL